MNVYNCTDIKATVAEKTLMTFISVVYIDLHEELLHEELLHEVLLYWSVLHDFIVVSCWSLYKKYPLQEMVPKWCTYVQYSNLALSDVKLKFCTVSKDSTVGLYVATAGTQGNGKPSVSRDYQTLFSSFQGST